jgi:hypothetical protein
MWVEFWDVPVDPSPNFQDQDVGLPVEASLKLTVMPVVSALGEKPKAGHGRQDWAPMKVRYRGRRG